MKRLIFVALLLISSASHAWWGPGYGGFGYGGYGYGGFYGGMPLGLMGYGYAIPAPSFNYNTVIQQSPPIIINEPAPVYQPAPTYQPPANTCPTNTCR